MSFRRKSGGSRRGGGRRMWLPDNDDSPLSSLLAMLAGSPRNKRKRTPPKKTRSKRRTPATPDFASRAFPSAVIPIEDTPESAQMLNAVQSKVGTFMESGSFISSDEDEVEIIKTKTKKESSPHEIFLSDDSDDGFKKIHQPSSSSNFMSLPGTSAGTSCNFAENSKPNTSNDDIMDLIDSVLPCTDSKNEDSHNHLKDLKSLEDFRKETEEMLKDASTLIDEIKTGRKAKPEPPKEQESSPKVTVGVCPICLESLASRSASVTVCGHIFCKSCIEQTAKTLKKCPTCRKAINVKKIHPIYF